MLRVGPRDGVHVSELEYGDLVPGSAIRGLDHTYRVDYVRRTGSRFTVYFRRVTGDGRRVIIRDYDAGTYVPVIPTTNCFHGNGKESVT